MSQLLTSAEIKKLKAGELFKSIMVVKSLTSRNDKNGRKYYEMTAIDSFGTVDAKIWSDASWFDRSADNCDLTMPAEQLSEEKIDNIAGCTVGIDGKVAEYKGQPQYNFNKLTLLNQKHFAPSNYMPQSRIPREKLEERFGQLVSGCRPEIAAFLRSVFADEMLSQFFGWPAAVSNHHAYANGLAEHSVSVADCAKGQAEAMCRSDYEIDVDITVAGALLHDIGKLRAYKMQTMPEITIEGAVIDHVALGYAMFEKLCEKYPLEEKIKLQIAHIIISHHGLREYGSPVVPETAEAMIVSSADELDFRMFCWHDSVKDLGENEPISAWNNATQRRFWNR